MTGDYRRRRSGGLPPILHPVSAVVLILLVSAGLIAASFMDLSGKKPGPKTAAAAKAAGPAGTQGPGAAVDNSAAGTGPGDSQTVGDEGVPGPLKNEGPGRGKGRGGRKGRQADTAEPSGGDEFAEVAAYQDEVMKVVDDAKTLTSKLDSLFAKNDKNEANTITADLRTLQAQVRKLRGITAPRSLQRPHSSLTNSFAISQRGYRTLLAYMQSGEISDLDRGKKDLENANNMRVQALKDISDYKKKIESSKPAPVKPPQPATETSPPEPPPPEPATTPEPPPQPQPTEPEEYPYDEGPLDGETYYPEDGGTIEPMEGDSVAPQDGETIPIEGDEYYEEYPQVEIPY